MLFFSSFDDQAGGLDARPEALDAADVTDIRRWLGRLRDASPSSKSSSTAAAGARRLGVQAAVEVGVVVEGSHGDAGVFSSSPSSPVGLCPCGIGEHTTTRARCSSRGDGNWGSLARRQRGERRERHLQRRLDRWSKATTTEGGSVDAAAAARRGRSCCYCCSHCSS